MNIATERWRRLSALFDECCELGAEARAARLHALAAEDAELARQLRALLDADARAEVEVDRPAITLAPEFTQAPAAIGPWRVLCHLGSGGMGEVWLAERADGSFDRRVAIKLLKRGMDSEQILARFLRERRILARLSHPHIARLLDGGRADDGRPYFVMEHVEGLPITAWAQARALSVDARLELLLAVCDAVDHAHRNLIVHRDLKPSNILVDADGTVKLLDFGIAKLIDADAATDPAVAPLTGTEMRVLTPTYAAPEQIRGEAVTTATDVYALGVLLYELLTGRLPHCREGSPQALAERLAHESIERPSHALATDPRRARPLRGDLDTIALTALRHEPERRYAGAAALAEDIRRHRAGRPIHARADALGYRLGRLLRRHRTAAAAAVTVLCAVFAGAAALGWQAHAAAREAHEASAIRCFLVNLFDASRAAADGVTPGDSLDGLLERGVRRLGYEFADALETRDAVYGTLVDIANLAHKHAHGAAIAQVRLTAAEAQWGVDDPRTAAALAGLGAALLDARQTRAAAAPLARARRLPGGDADDVPRLMQALSEGIYAYLGGRTPDFDRDPAIAAVGRLRALHPDAEVLPFALDWYARLALATGHADAAAAAIADLRRLTLPRLGPGHENLAHADLREAELLLAQGQPATALPRIEKALALLQRLADGGDVERIEAQALAATALLALGRDAEAHAHWTELAAARRDELEDAPLQARLATLAARFGADPEPILATTALP